MRLTYLAHCHAPLPYGSIIFHFSFLCGLLEAVGGGGLPLVVRAPAGDGVHDQPTGVLKSHINLTKDRVRRAGLPAIIFAPAEDVSISLARTAMIAARANLDKLAGGR